MRQDKAGSHKGLLVCRRDAAYRAVVFQRYHSPPFWLYYETLVPGLTPARTILNRKIGEQIFKIGGFSGELLWNRLRYPLTGTTATRVVKCALHTLTFTSSGATIIHIIATGRTADWSRNEQQHQDEHIRQLLQHQAMEDFTF